MNIKELIEGYERISNFCETVSINKLIQKLKQLDEPQKVKVPQCVAEYINLQKKNNFHVYGAMRVIEDHYDKKVPEWFYEKNIETFVRAWLDGYEVEKEKRYTVVMKETKQPLYYNAGDKKIFFSLGGLATNFTQKQLEAAGFGWVFDCEGVEVKEVEE